jgi:outer membrane biosynthesis protein TonB
VLFDSRARFVRNVTAIALAVAFGCGAPSQRPPQQQVAPASADAVSVSRSGSPRSAPAAAKSSALECVPANKLQTVPRKIRDRKPELSDLLGVQTHAGVVVFDVIVGPSGRVIDARLVKPIDAEHPWPTIAERSRAAISDWRFEPATVDNKPVAACVTVTLNLEVR